MGKIAKHIKKLTKCVFSRFIRQQTGKSPQTLIGGLRIFWEGEEEWRRLLTTDFHGRASLTLASFGVAQA